MNQNIIKYWNKKSLLATLILNIIVIIFFVTFSAIFIKVIEDKLIIIILTLLTNVIIMLIIYGFSISNTAYETVYQIETDKQGYNAKLYRYILILLGITWLVFFITTAFFMFAYAVANKESLDYFNTLNQQWWIALIISLYHVSLIAIHRQLIHYAIHHQTMPWEKLRKNKKKQ